VRHLILFFALTLAAYGQANPVIRFYTYAGAPTSADCDAASEIGNRIGFDTSGTTDLIYDCLEVSSTIGWVVRASGGTVTSVGWTGGIVSVANPTTTPAFTIAGTSGGVVYFSSATTWASSTAPPAGQLMVWGGAGAAPTGIASNTYQTLDADLTAIAGLSPSRGALIRRGASDWEAVALGGVGALLYSDGTDAVWLARVSASAAINFGSIADGACLENTFTLTGAAFGDPVALGMSADLGTGLQATAAVSAADTAKIKVCNLSGAAVDPASITFTARIAR
jgi:hypothetical protein